jgi:hypothetical protein
LYRKITPQRAEGRNSIWRTALAAKGYTATSVSSWINRGLLTMVLRETENLYGLLLETIAERAEMARVWSRCGQVWTDFVADKIDMIRYSSTKRIIFIFRVYIMLREWDVENFNISEVNGLLIEAEFRYQAGSAPHPVDQLSRRGGEGICTHCGSHQHVAKKRGQVTCPFLKAEIDKTKAAGLGAKLDEKVGGGIPIEVAVNDLIASVV